MYMSSIFERHSLLLIVFKKQIFRNSDRDELLTKILKLNALYTVIVTAMLIVMIIL